MLQYYEVAYKSITITIQLENQILKMQQQLNYDGEQIEQISSQLVVN